MDARLNIDEAIRRAIERERELWMQCRGKLPGDPGFSEKLCLEWRLAANTVNVLSLERMQMRMDRPLKHE